VHLSDECVRQGRTIARRVDGYGAKEIETRTLAFGSSDPPSLNTI
jgi:hypothetical protein